MLAEDLRSVFTMIPTHILFSRLLPRSRTCSTKDIELERLVREYIYVYERN